MTELEWENLQIGDIVHSVDSDYAKNLIVSEICTDERSLSKWKVPNARKLIKFSGKNGFHTWDVCASKWDLND